MNKIENFGYCVGLEDKLYYKLPQNFQTFYYVKFNFLFKNMLNMPVNLQFLCI